MTTLYFVRHAQPDFTCHDDDARPLTPKGQADTALVTAWLADKGVAAVYSSPYRRAVETIRPFALRTGLAVTEVRDLRERKITDDWIDDFDGYCRRWWAEPDYALPGGESLRAVRARCAAATARLVAAHPGQSIAAAGHGTALCALISHYRPYGHADFARMKALMPWGAVLRFDDDGAFASFEAVDLLGGAAAAENDQTPPPAAFT